MQDCGSHRRCHHTREVPGEREKCRPSWDMAYVHCPGLSKSGLDLGQTDARDLSRSWRMLSQPSTAHASFTGQGFWEKGTRQAFLSGHHISPPGSSILGSKTKLKEHTVTRKLRWEKH